MQPREFSARTLQLLTSGAGPTEDPMLDMEIQLSVLYTWAGRVRSGNIDLLDLRQYDFYPTEWFVIFENRLMILGSYVHDVHSVGKVGTTQQAFVVRPHGEGAALIQLKLDSFDMLFAAAETQFGPGKYEGRYELIDSVVKLKKPAATDWEELNAVSQSIPGPP